MLFCGSKTFFYSTSYITVMLNRLDPHQARHFVRPIWVKTVCKGYKQTTLEGNELSMFLSFCLNIIMFWVPKTVLYPAILGKGPWQKLGKYDWLNFKIGEKIDIKHNNGSKIYPQNHFFIRKCLHILQIWVNIYIFEAIL